MNVSISDLCNNVDIFVQDPLNEGAWWHSACDTATSHLWVSQRLRLHRRGLDNIQENNFNKEGPSSQMVYVAVAMLATNTIASLGVIVVRCVPCSLSDFQSDEFEPGTGIILFKALSKVNWSSTFCKDFVCFWKWACS